MTITKALKEEVVLKVKREEVEGVVGVGGVVVEGVVEGVSGELLLCLLLLWLLGGKFDQPAGVHELLSLVGTLDPVAPGGPIQARVWCNNGDRLVVPLEALVPQQCRLTNSERDSPAIGSAPLGLVS